MSRRLNNAWRASSAFLASRSAARASGPDVSKRTSSPDSGSSSSTNPTDGSAYSSGSVTVTGMMSWRREITRNARS